MNNRNEIYISLIAAVIVLAISFTYLTRSNTVKVALLADLSGRKSQLGIASRNAIQMAVKEYNEKGGIAGRKIELFIFDNKGDPEVCEKEFDKIKQMNIPFVIGPHTSNMATVTLKAAEDKSILVISPTISTDKVKGIDDNFIRLIPVSSLQTEILAKEVIAQKIKSISIVYDTSNREYTEPMYLLFKEIVEKNSVSVNYVCPLTPNDRKSAVADKVNKSDSEALLIITSGIDASMITQHVYKLNKSIKLFGVNWTRTGDIIASGGKSVEGMIFSSPYEAENPPPEYVKFKENYRHEFKVAPGFSSEYAYESFQILAESIAKSRSTDLQKVKKAIITKGSFSGLKDSFIIDKFGDCTRGGSLLIIENKKFKIYK
jgi:branched-chain amino acid transport system substrate-binding protein